MKLKELAAEYRQSAEAIKRRVEQLRKKMDEPSVKYEERFLLSSRITELEVIMAETMRDAYYMENYYLRAGERK